MEWLTRRALRFPGTVCLLAIGAAALAGAGLPRIATEVGYRGVLGDSHPSVLELDAFIDRFGGGLPVFAAYSCAEPGPCASVFDEAPLRMASSVEEAMSDLLGDNDLASLSPEQRAQLEERAAAAMKQRQRVPMLRVVKDQPKKLIEVQRYTDLNRTRYSQPW